MANVAAIRIEHTRLAEVEQTERMHAKELEQAAEIQRRLLPTRAPATSGVDLAGYNARLPHCGRRLLRFFALSRRTRRPCWWATWPGKGMPAALLMSSLQARVQVLFDDPPIWRLGDAAEPHHLVELPLQPVH